MKPGFKIKAVTVRNGEFTYRTHKLTGWKPDGTRVRLNFKSRQDAEGERNRLEVEAANANSGTRAITTRLTAAQVAEAETAFARLGDRSLAKAVDWFLENYRPPVAEKPLADTPAENPADPAIPGAISLFLADRAPHISAPQMRDYRRTLGFLLAAFPRHSVADCKTEDIEALLKAKASGKKRHNNMRADLHAFFAFCMAHARKWTRENPVAGTTKFKIARGIPEIITPEKAAEIMAYLETYKGPDRCGHEAGFLVPFFALCLFAGTRPSVDDGEIRKLSS